MKRFFVGIISCLAGLIGGAQVTMTPLVPAVGIVQKPQLWNMIIINTNAETMYCKVSLVISDQSTNQPVLTGETIFTAVPEGATQFSSENFEPIQYTYPSSLYTDPDPNGFLSVGSYEACYTLSKIISDYSEILSEQCMSITVEPLSPPILNMPEDQSELITTSPQFTWLPPQPLTIFNYLTYDLLVTEILAGQSANDALQQNIPAYTASNLTDIYNNYPSSYTPLDSSKLYAWQIIAKNNGQFAAQSDIWSFKIISPEDSAILKKTEDIPFVKLKRITDASFAECFGNLKFYYDNDAEDSLVNYTIENISEEDIGKVESTGIIPLKQGRNLVIIPLIRDARLMDGGFYQFSFINSRNEVWKIKFIYSETETDNTEEN